MDNTPIINNFSNKSFPSGVILIAKIISYLFHPLFMTSLIFGFIYFIHPLIISHAYNFTIPMFFFVTFFSSCFLPYTVIYLHYRAGTISSMSLDDIKDRKSILYYLMFYFIASTMFTINEMAIDEPYFLITAGVTTAMVACTILTHFFKISYHATGCGGLTGIMILIFFFYPEKNSLFPLMISIVISGLVISSRLILKVHTPKETFWGFLVGFLSCFWFCFSKIYHD